MSTSSTVPSGGCVQFRAGEMFAPNSLLDLSKGRYVTDTTGNVTGVFR